MATSGTVSTTKFDTRKVIDHAFRRCRISAQRVTAEYQQIAQDLLYLVLSELSSVKTPSWCIEKIILPFYTGQPNITLPLGTVEVLNANYRYLQTVSFSVATNTATEYKAQFDTSTTNVSTIGIRWAGASVPLEVFSSPDNAVWTKILDIDVDTTSGEITWVDITPQATAGFIKITSTAPFLRSEVYFGNMPIEIPFGVLNRDSYVAQANQIFQGRPTTYWFQRDINQPILHLWPAPNPASEYAQLIVWRHRYIQDVGTLQETLDIPQRWFEAIVAALASKLAMEIDVVDPTLIPVLTQLKSEAVLVAWNGDNDGSPTTIAPYISPYTR